MTRRFSKLLACLVLAGLVLIGCSRGGSMRTADDSQTGVTLRASKGEDTSLAVERALPEAEVPQTEPDTWTVFVYLCGTDLESDYGNGTDDLAEMVAAAGGENVSFVVQTGGAKSWVDDDMDSSKSQRFLIQDGSIQEVSSLDPVNMGEEGTLADFLQWGLENYPADKMGVVLWNHGGGSIAGVCFDEQNNDDSLVLRELDSAFASVLPSMWQKFEFVGFDACLMSSIELANVMGTYSNYLYASEEWEPAAGWDYGAIVEYLAQNPDADGASLGKEVCDAYMESITDEKDQSMATLAVTDLSQTDDLLQSFNTFSQDLFEATEEEASLAQFVRSMSNVDNFGGNNRAEGYVNMVDLAGLVGICEQGTRGADDVLAAIDDMVVYHREGETHANARGLSVYYPLKIEDAKELATFEQVCVSPYYLSFIDRIAHGSVYGGEGQYEDYDADTWFQDDAWTSDFEESDEGYWDFVDKHDEISTLISFAQKPHFDKDGVYTFQLDEQGLSSAADVRAMVYMLSEDEDYFLSLGETYDIEADWGTGWFADMFDGWWLSLPDGQPLCLYVAESTDDYLVYTSPISLNGKDTHLRLRQYFDDGRVEVEGAWAGISESGAAARGIEPIKKGDKIVPLYDAHGTDDDDQTTYEGWEYKADSSLEVTYGPLEAGTYSYSFCVDDMYGDYYLSDSVEFEIDDRGEVSFVE